MFASEQKFYFGTHATRTNKRVTNAFLWLCTLAYLGLFIASLFLLEWQLAPLDQNPLLGADKSVLTRLGATAAYKISGSNQWWRLISSPFVCAGTMHLWATSSAVWTFGLFLSNVMAPWQLIIVFAVSGLAGVTVSANVAADFVTSAASGPIFGFIGGTCATLIMHWRAFQMHAVTWLMLALVLGLNIFMGCTPFVDQSCNLAGFVAGVLAALSMLVLNKQSMSAGAKETTLQVVCCVLLAVALLISVIAVVGLNLSRSPVAGCCDKLVCANSPLWDCDAARVNQPCTFTRYGNGTTILYCPTGVGQAVVPPASTDAQMLAQCDTVCSGAVSANNNPSTGGTAGVPGNSA